MTKTEQMQAEIRRLQRLIRDKDRQLAAIKDTSATLKARRELLPNPFEHRED